MTLENTLSTASLHQTHNQNKPFYPFTRHHPIITDKAYYSIHIFSLNFHRWLSLMLSQEFALPDVLRIWDSLLADETRSDFLIDVCTAMVLVIREDILTNDFADNVKLLQVKFYSFAITFSKKLLFFCL